MKRVPAYFCHSTFFRVNYCDVRAPRDRPRNPPVPLLPRRGAQPVRHLNTPRPSDRLIFPHVREAPPQSPPLLIVLARSSQRQQSPPHQLCWELHRLCTKQAAFKSRRSDKGERDRRRLQSAESAASKSSSSGYSLRPVRKTEHPSDAMALTAPKRPPL